MGQRAATNQPTPSTKASANQEANSGGLWVLAATILGSSMVFIDGSVVNVALPRMQTDLNATVADMQWVVEGYTLFLAALLLVGGSLGDHYGRKRIYGLGVILFTLASAWCGLAPDALQLIIARSVQGIGGALLVPGSLAIISAYFTGAERGRAIGTWSAFTSITTALGPVLGGFLVENASWRWVFFLNVPIAVAVLASLYTHVPESRDPNATGHLDWRGATLATVGLGGLVYGLVEASNQGFDSPIIIAALAIGVLSLALFLLVEARVSQPMMPLYLFRSSTFTGANLLTLFLYGALAGAFFFLPFNLLQVQGYSATAVGAAFLPFIVLLATLSRWTGGLVGKYGAKLLLVVGPLVSGLGFALFALPGIGGSYWTTFFPATVVLGLGMAITVAPLTTAVMNAVEVSHSGIASGINNAVSRTAGLIAIAVLGIVAFNVFNSSLDTHLSTLQLPQEVRQSIDTQRDRLAGIELPPNLPAEAATQARTAINESYVDAFRANMLIAAALAAASAISALLFVEGKPSPNRDPET
jgi:EmrB/QacA subfamily drug resistance transporter